MAVRGVVTNIEFYPITGNVNTDPPLYAYQNHFPAPRILNRPTAADYNSFTITPLSNQKDVSSMPGATIAFVATADNVDLVEEAIANKYIVLVLVSRWGAGSGSIDDPAGVNLFAVYIAMATGGGLDTSTVSLNISHYSNNINADMPWRKIPWTIIGPLSFRG